MKEKVLITGGCGFIGSHVCMKLVEAGYQIVIIDDLSSGDLKHVNTQLFTIYQASILSADFKKIVLQEQPTYIIHLAAQVSVASSIQDVDGDASLNINGTINVIEAAVAGNVKKLIFASSAAVYGIPTSLPIDTLHPINPTSPYGLSKYAAEQYIQLYSRLHGLDFTILRFANVYGPKQDVNQEGGVVAIFIDQLLRQQQPVIYGDGEQTRDFIFVEDVASACLKSLTRAHCKVLNISSGKEISINKLASILKQITSQHLIPKYLPAREGDIYQSVLNNQATKEALLWQPEFELYDGLLKTFRHHVSEVQ